MAGAGYSWLTVAMKNTFKRPTMFLSVGSHNNAAGTAKHLGCLDQNSYIHTSDPTPVIDQLCWILLISLRCAKRMLG